MSLTTWLRRQLFPPPPNDSNEERAADAVTSAAQGLNRQLAPYLRHPDPLAVFMADIVNKKATRSATHDDGK